MRYGKFIESSFLSFEKIRNFEKNDDSLKNYYTSIVSRNLTVLYKDGKSDEKSGFCLSL